NTVALKAVVDSRCRAGLVHGVEGKNTRRLLRRLESQCPDSSDFCDSRARYQIALGNWGKGLSSVGTFVLIHPNSPQGWYYYALWLYKAGLVEAAMRAISEASRLRPDPTVKILDCELIYATGLFDRLNSAIGQMLALYPHRADCLARAAVLLSRI